MNIWLQLLAHAFEGYFIALGFIFIHSQFQPRDASAELFREHQKIYGWLLILLPITAVILPR